MNVTIFIGIALSDVVVHEVPYLVAVDQFRADQADAAGIVTLHSLVMFMHGMIIPDANGSAKGIPHQGIAFQDFPAINVIPRMVDIEGTGGISCCIAYEKCAFLPDIIHRLALRELYVQAFPVNGIYSAASVIDAVIFRPVMIFIIVAEDFIRQSKP